MISAWIVTEYNTLIRGVKALVARIWYSYLAYTHTHTHTHTGTHTHTRAHTQTTATHTLRGIPVCEDGKFIGKHLDGSITSCVMCVRACVRQCTGLDVWVC